MLKKIIKDTKTCTQCKTNKPRSEFNAAKHSSDGKHSVCRTCHRLKESIKDTLAKQEGMTRQEWRKLPAEERRSKEIAAFKEALGVPATIRIKKKSVNDPILNEVRKRHQIELAKLNNSQTGIKEGFVYAITNPAFPNMVSIGCALDYEKRVNSYQRYDPNQCFEIRHTKYFEDREAMESKVHAMLYDKMVLPKSEWFRVTLEYAKNVIDNL